MVMRNAVSQPQWRVKTGKPGRIGPKSSMTRRLDRGRIFCCPGRGDRSPMRRSVSASSVGASAALCGLLRTLPIAIVMIPAAAMAQQTSNPASDSNTIALPEVRVIATTPVAPPRPAAKPSAATVVPAQSTAAPAQGAGARAEPGVIDRDKVPSNVQTMSASDFDHAKAPNLLDSLERGLPGVSLSDQTGNQFQQDLNYRGFIASPVIGTPQGSRSIRTACASTKSLATSSIGTSSRRTPSTS